jgi:RNA polymerase sigma-70 factor (ECF subfamily)
MTGSTVLEAQLGEHVVRRAAGGDEAAFSQLVAEHHASMVRVAAVITDDPDTALDAVQSAWALAWRRLGSLRDPDQVGPWLVAVAANEARGLVRRRRRRHLVELPFGESDRSDPEAPDPVQGISDADLDRALRHLNPDERSLLALRYVAGYDSTEIARLLRISPSGVRTRLARLLDRLRRELDAA